MTRFHNYQKVKVVAPEEWNQPVNGMTGIVVKLRRSDDAAWVKMDCDLPVELQSFPPGDERHRDLKLYPDECQLVTLPC